MYDRGIPDSVLYGNLAYNLIYYIGILPIFQREESIGCFVESYLFLEKRVKVSEE